MDDYLLAGHAELKDLLRGKVHWWNIELVVAELEVGHLNVLEVRLDVVVDGEVFVDTARVMNSVRPLLMAEQQILQNDLVCWHDYLGGGSVVFLEFIKHQDAIILRRFLFVFPLLSVVV